LQAVLAAAAAPRRHEHSPTAPKVAVEPRKHEHSPIAPVDPKLAEERLKELSGVDFSAVDCDAALCREPGNTAQTGNQTLCEQYRMQGHGCVWMEASMEDARAHCRVEPCFTAASRHCALKNGWDINSCDPLHEVKALDNYVELVRSWERKTEL